MAGGRRIEMKKKYGGKCKLKTMFLDSVEYKAHLYLKSLLGSRATKSVPLITFG